MKCELCGSHNVTQQMEQDMIHNRMGARRVLVCRECGFRRNLDECHSEASLNQKDVTARELAQEKAEAYQKIRQAWQQPRRPQKGFYHPPAYQTGQKAKGTSNANGCAVLFVIAVVVLIVLGFYGISFGL